MGGKISGLRASAASRPLRGIFIPGERFVDASLVLHSLVTILAAAPAVSLIDSEALEVSATALDATSHEIMLTNGHVVARTILIAARPETTYRRSITYQTFVRMRTCQWSPVAPTRRHRGRD